MDSTTFQLLPHRTAENQNIFSNLAQKLHEESKGETFYPAVKVLERPRFYFLVVRIFRPLAKRPLGLPLDDIEEAGLFEEAIVTGRKIDWTACFLASFEPSTREPQVHRPAGRGFDTYCLWMLRHRSTTGIRLPMLLHGDEIESLIETKADVIDLFYSDWIAFTQGLTENRHVPDVNSFIPTSPSNLVNGR